MNSIRKLPVFEVEQSGKTRNIRFRYFQLKPMDQIMQLRKLNFREGIMLAGDSKQLSKMGITKGGIDVAKLSGAVKAPDAEVNEVLSSLRLREGDAEKYDSYMKALLGRYCKEEDVLMPVPAAKLDLTYLQHLCEKQEMPTKEKIDYFVKLLCLFAYEPEEKGMICGKLTHSLVSDKGPKKKIGPIERARFLIEVCEGIYGKGEKNSKLSMAFMNEGLKYAAEKPRA
jgi:hypothetical protein